MIKAVFFDVDGTILNTKEFILQAFEHVFTVNNKPHLTRNHVQSLVGKALEECYECLIPEIQYELLHAEHFKFQMSHLHLIETFPQIKEVLTQLKTDGIKLAAITNRTKRSVHVNLQSHGLYDLFDLILCIEDVKNLKPHPEPLLKAMKQCKVKPSEVIMVGDTESDIKAGKGAGVKTVGVTYGFHSKQEMKACHPDYMIHSINELFPIINSIN